MENKVILITCYFGRLPNYFEAWLKSCKKNSNIDYLVITDQVFKRPNPSNVKFVTMSWEKLVELVQSKFDFKICLHKPYKLCDYKPAFGLIFDEYIRNYDFWGHCDIDLIWGDINSFVTDELLSKYDKIFHLGHLSIYRNKSNVNNSFKEKGSMFSYKFVFQHKESFGFDEYSGMKRIYDNENNHYKMFKQAYCADINKSINRFTIYQHDPKIRNYDNQIFYWDNGKVFRAYINGEGSVVTDEFIYIHFSSRDFKFNNCELNNSNSFYILPTGFKYKENGTPTYEEVKLLSGFISLAEEQKERKKYKKQSIKEFLRASLIRKVIWTRIHYKI